MANEPTILERSEGAVAPKMEGAMLPDFIKSAPPVEMQSRANAPFVHIAQPKSLDFWGKLVQRFPGVKEGNAFLFMPGGDRIIKLDPFRFSLVLAKQFYVRTSPNGRDVVEIKLRDPGRPFKERIVTVLAVFTPDGECVPAVCEFRSTKCNCVHTAHNALKEADGPDWAKISPEHALTLQCPKPFMRFFVEATPSPRPPRGDGMPFVLLTGHAKPTGAVEWDAFAKLVTDPRSIERLNTVNNEYDRKVSEYEAKIN